MSPDGNSGALRVFIVEDEPILAMNAEDMLNEVGHKVTAIATRIDKALALAGNSEFNLAILDINLRERRRLRSRTSCGRKEFPSFSQRDMA